MQNFGIVIFLFSVLVCSSFLIKKVRMPAPIFFVLAGLFIGFVPLFPTLKLDPEVVFVIFLPPLLYDTAVRTSWSDFKADIRPITALAVSLVFCTMSFVALIAHCFIPGFSWPLAFLLGAIVSPPDAVAATGIIKGLGLDKRIITILEGESMVNDASALIAYKYALIAVATGNFIFWKAGMQFLLMAAGGIVVGILIGYILYLFHKKVKNKVTTETSLTLLTPFLSYLSAEQLNVSGILSVVSTGIFLSWHAHEIFAYQTRSSVQAVWKTMMFLLNGFVFILIGMQLPDILSQLSSYTWLQLSIYGLIISMVTILSRILWVFAGAYAYRLFPFIKWRKTMKLTSKPHEDGQTWKSVFVISWTGTRGIISLSAALAIPLTLATGHLFPQRAMIIFLCFVVIFTTLVVQGMSLMPLLDMLGIKPIRKMELEMLRLQLHIAQETVAFIGNEYTSDSQVIFKNILEKEYQMLALHIEEEINQYVREGDIHRTESLVPLPAIQKAHIEIIGFQRELLLNLHKNNIFDSDVIRKVESNIDLDEMLFDRQNPYSK
ncbi:Na+/H+ antiporter [Rhizosphaericola mali]|uniref:Na+/H+ antiporter n=1 Tax=Rhizosphaericola mali TaxID=2545455 RepID=A0A5P2G053_9BACT|nr:Na+/H+ antiporter [Rhizosphaericola mali]QES88028.1 Na+/H+ antiporter [Rhizosphaericola mali]